MQHSTRRKRHKGSSLIPLYTSLCGMILCMACLAGSSWAWFTANQTVGTVSITSAHWVLETVAVDEMPVTVTDNAATFTAAANTEYAVSVTAGGNASSGYLLIETCDGNFCTRAPKTEFTLLLSQSGTVTVTAAWGQLPADAGEFASGDRLGSGTLPEATEPETTEPETTESATEAIEPEA